MHGMARVAIANGNRGLAERHARAAIEINPRAAEYRATLAEICGSGAVAGERALPVARTAACPCGSGRRYKACCGQLAAGPPEVAAAAHSDVEALCAVAQRALDHGDAPAAFEVLQRAAAIRCDDTVGRLLESCCERIFEGVARASLWAMAHRLRDGSGGARPAPASGRVLLVGPAEGRDSLLEAACQAGVAAPGAEVMIAHGVDDMTIATRINGDTCVVFCDPDTVPAHGVAGPGPGRVVIRMPRDDPAALVRGFARVADGWPDARLDYFRTVNLKV
jgi:hypothetical protein